MNLTCTDYLLPKFSSEMAENGTIRAHKEAQKGHIWSRKMVLSSYNWAPNSLKPLNIKSTNARDSY